MLQNVLRKSEKNLEEVLQVLNSTTEKANQFKE